MSILFIQGKQMTNTEKKSPSNSSHLNRKPVMAPILSEWNLTLIDNPELIIGAGTLSPQYFHEKDPKDISK